MGVAQNVSAFRFPLSAFGNGVVTAITPRMAAANPFRGQNRTRHRPVRPHCVQRVLRTRRRETAAAGTEQKRLRGRKRETINAQRENQNVLEQIHDSVLEQVRAFQHGEKILFHSGKILLGNRIPRDENQFNGLREFMLVQPETFTQQPPGAAADGRITDFFAGDDAEFGRAASRQFAPVGDEAAEHQTFALLPDAREIAILRQT